MRILVTGFEPFGGDKVNPAKKVVCNLAASGVPGVDLYTAILPVDQVAGPAGLLQAVTDHDPEAVVCLGLATGRAEINIERVAINLQDFPIPDNAGNEVVDMPVIAGGPAAYFTTLPVRTLLAGLHQEGIPARLSLTAGAFLCNQVTYVLLHDLVRRGRAIPAGFIHLPALPEQVTGRSRRLPSMALETQTAAVHIVLRTLIAQN